MSINSIEELVRTLKNIEHEEIRNESETYLEIVFNTGVMDKIKPVLEDYYGPAFKQAGVKAEPEVNEISKAYGGVQKEQALYYKNSQGISQLAMLWPWQDGKRITIKIIQDHQ